MTIDEQIRENAETELQRLAEAEMLKQRDARLTAAINDAIALTEKQEFAGIGGAPTRATTFPNTAKGRKETPVASGVLDYFPDAIVAIAQVSFAGNEQHNPGQPLHWARSKSGDEGDALMRHFLQRGDFDTDGVRHSAKMAWRALALLQKEIESTPRLKPTGGSADCDAQSHYQGNT
jgi:hypothetical protein